MASLFSDMKIETTRESHESVASVPLCDKNPGHVGFYSVNDLNKDILPDECKTDSWLSWIRYHSKRVVKLTVDKANGAEYGSGYVDKCTDLNTWRIRTNHHVIGSQEDVDNCTVEFHYDTVDKTGIETSSGVKLDYCNESKDLCWFTFTPVPQTIIQLMSEVHFNTPPETVLHNNIVISHPHGGPKIITIGEYLGGEWNDGEFRHLYTTRTCPGSSGGLVFNTRWGNNLHDWRVGLNSFTHFSGLRREYYKQTLTKTGNVNYSVFW